MDNPNTSFPSFEDMQKRSKKLPHFVVAIVVLIVVGLGVIWYFYKANNQLDQYSIPGEVHKSKAVNNQEPQSQLESINIKDLDTEFNSIDKDISSL